MKKRKSRPKVYVKYGRGITRPYVNKRNRLMLGSGTKITRPYVNKRNHLMLGSGKKKKIGKQKGGFLPALFMAVAPTALELISKIIK